MKKFEISRDPLYLEKAWTVTSFKEAYSESKLACCALLTNNLTPKESNKNNSVITLRTFIQSDTPSKTKQNYVLLLRFYNFGHLATIDLVSFKKGACSEIAYKHIKNMYWPYFGEQLTEGMDYTKVMYQAPMIVSNGELLIGKEKIIFSGVSSGRWTNDIFMGLGNQIAYYVAKMCGLNCGYFPGRGSKFVGEDFISGLLKFMKENKCKNNFYELFIDYIQKNNIEAKNFNPQNLSGLVMMKATDRASLEQETLDSLIAEETFIGLKKQVLSIIHSKN